MSSKIVIVDYGMGNLNSVRKVLDRIGGESIISADRREIADCDKLILPGVGHFGKAMWNLKNSDLVKALNDAVLNERKPILGICLGMQLMAKKSEEGESEGLGWLDDEVVKLKVSDRVRHKVPHMGWNRNVIRKPDVLLNGISEAADFYFMHSYHLKLENEDYLVSETMYDSIFPSAIRKENIFGVQYHPEKSHDAGAQLLKNFIEL